MVLQVNEVFTSYVLVVDANGNRATGKTINYRVYDESFSVFDSGTMDELGYGIYYKAWTPDAEGLWGFEAYYTGSDFRFFSLKSYPVRTGVEKFLYDAITNATYGLSALNTDLDAILAELANGTYGLAALEALVDEIESLLKNATYGLSALKTEIDANETKIDNVDSDLGTHDTDIKALLESATYGLAQLQLEIAALENKLKASPSVDSILFKAGGAVCPDGKSVWDALGDATVSLNTLNNLLTDGTYGLSALETLVDEVESLLKDATYGLSALNDDLDDIISKIGSPSVSLAADIAAIENKLKASPSVDSILFKLGGAVCPASKSIWDALGDGTKSIIDVYNYCADLYDQNDDIIGELGDGTYGLPALNADLDTIIANIGDFQGQSNLRTLLAVLGVPDVSGKPLYTVLVTDRLDNATYGLNALKTLIDAVQTDLDNPDQFKADVSALALEATLTAIKGGGWSIETLKAIYDAIVAVNTDLGDFSSQTYLQSLLAALGIPDVSGKPLYTCLVTDRLDHGTYGLSAIKTLIDTTNAYVDEVESLLKDGTYGLSALDTDLGTLLTRLSSTRAGYLDNLSAGAVALEATLTAIKGIGWTAETLKATYDLLDSILDLTRTADTLTADGTEQNVYINDAPSSLFKPLKILIDTTNMALNDDITIKIYYRLKDGGNPILATDEDFSDAQTIPLKIYDLQPNLYGIKVTLEQTAGTNRTYDWECYYNS